MFRTSQHPHIAEAVRQAETLHRFKIVPEQFQWALYLTGDDGKEKRVGLVETREIAEEFLFSKLPVIESEM